MEAESKIHPLAIVHENAKIGKNVEIGPFAVIGENVEIGDGTRIEPHAVITGWTKIGKDCVIFRSIYWCRTTGFKICGRKILCIYWRSNKSS